MKASLVYKEKQILNKISIATNEHVHVSKKWNIKTLIIHLTTYVITSRRTWISDTDSRPVIAALSSGLLGFSATFCV